MKPYLTMILMVDIEKPTEYTWAFFRALARWNRKAMDRIQVLAITQKRNDRETLRLASQQPFPVDVIHARHEFAGEYPIWDVCDAVKRAWGLVQGEYVTFCHQEFLTLPHRLTKTMRFLERNGPDIALGNLRRPLKPGRAKYAKARRMEALEECREVLRLMRDQRALSGEVADGISGAISAALDELSVMWGVEL